MLDRAARMLGNSLDTVGFWKQADQQEQGREAQDSGSPATARLIGTTLTVDEFFDAIAGNEERYELVEGFARRLVRADQGRNVIRSNVLAALVPAGKREGCRVMSVNTGVRTGPNTIRYPDVVVDGGPPDRASTMASRPAIIVEVLSSESSHEAVLREYRSLAGTDTILQIQARAVFTMVHRRREDGAWETETVENLDDAIALPKLRTSLTMRDIYDQVEVRHPGRR